MVSSRRDRVIDMRGVDALLAVLRESGAPVIGPVVRDGAIVHGEIASTADLPAGWHDEQRPGSYRLRSGGDPELFGWAVGPASWKSQAFPPREELWRAFPEGATVSFAERPVPPGPAVLFGVRPCEIAALAVLDRVLDGGGTEDPGYAARRRGSFVVAVECGSPSGTCFCTSMGTGPEATSGFDLALTELLDEEGHDFYVRVATEEGADVIEAIPGRDATPSDVRRREAVGARANERFARSVEAEGLRELLAGNLDHPRWDEVAQRCLSCGNCTLVCPTCFCSDVHDTTDLSGTVRRERSWASCFDPAHSYVHGGPVLVDTASRYRQWLTHKFSTWFDQFGSSGCVGCGRCIAWCPVGIDVTEELGAIRATDGATAAASDPAPRPRRTPVAVRSGRP